jgi:hypothetical protein
MSGWKSAICIVLRALMADLAGKPSGHAGHHEMSE